MFFKKKKKNIALIIYTKIAEQSRKAYFYNELEVPNSFEGRLEILTFNLALILWSLKKYQNMSKLSQELCDIFFQDLDNSLRELGVSDLSVGKKIKILAENFFGRLISYTEAFEDCINSTNTSKVEKVLKKNIKNLKTTKSFNIFFQKYISENIFFFSHLDANSLSDGNFNYKVI